MNMPYGKHEGTTIEKLPEEYFWWLYRNPSDYESEEADELREAVEAARHAHLAVVRQRYAQLKRHVFRKSKHR